MTPGDALMRAICENPRDDLPRLVYADWLEENGQPGRAAFLRKELDIYARPEWDRERLRYERAIRDLPGRSEAHPWARPVGVGLPRWAYHSRWPVLRRGFPWSVGVDDLAALSGPAAGELFDRVPVENLDLRHVPDVGRLATNPRLARLTGVSWRNGHAGPRPAAAFGGSPYLAGLRGLGLAAGSLTAEGLAALVRTPVFRGLTAFDGDRLPPRLVRALLDGPGPGPRLTSLSLRAAPLGDEGFGLLLAAGLRAGPESLCLAGTGLNAARVEVLAGTAAIAGLRVLNLSANPVGNAGAAAIAASPHLPNLLVLDLSYCQVGDDGVRAILDSPPADRLVMLDLTGSPASAETKQELTARMGDRVRV
jgi:uncharacterized protein (TIGR02996 family)